jgi:hypothetical protein
MSKKYLNNQEQQLAFFFAGVSEAAVERLKDNHIDGLERKALKYMKTYGQKALKDMLDPVDITEAKVIYKRSRNVMFGVFTKDDYRKQLEKEIELNKLNALTDEELLGLGESALASCSLCESTGEEVEDCKTRKALLKCQIAPIKNHGECPFKVDKESESK